MAHIPNWIFPVVSHSLPASQMYPPTPSYLPPSFSHVLILFASQMNKQLVTLAAPQLERFNKTLHGLCWVTFKWCCLVGKLYISSFELHTWTWNHLLFLYSYPNSPALLSRHAVSSHQKIQLSHSWASGVGCILSLLTRFLNPSLGELSQAVPGKHSEEIFFFFHHHHHHQQHLHFGEG